MTFIKSTITSSMLLKNIKPILAILVLPSMAMTTPIAQANILTLDFTAYPTSMCINNSCSNGNTAGAPIDYLFSLDTDSILNTANTNAYNNTPNYTETVNTTITHGSNINYSSVYSYSSASINQTYTQNKNQLGTNSAMSLGVTFQNNYQEHPVTNGNYTGNLPAELVPSDSNSANTFINGNINVYMNAVIGSTPAFTVFDATQLKDLFDRMVGMTFSFNQFSSTSICTQLDLFGNCMGQWSTNLSSSTGGNAVLASVSISPTLAADLAAPVPVPAALWFFVSGLGFWGWNSRRKA